MAIINREMRENADAFILRWRGTTAERAEAQTFTNDSQSVISNLEKGLLKIYTKRNK